MSYVGSYRDRDSLLEQTYGRSADQLDAIVPYGTSCILGMKNLTKGLGCAIRRIHCDINVVHTNNVSFTSFVECIEVYVNMIGAFYEMILVDHFDRSLVVNE